MTSKKVQTEADRLLKKVNEGLEGYDELHEKLSNAPNASAKERLEGDLKRELKKLQRHREAMKAFLQNDDYKEKPKMQTARKRIEERMESFRAIEREMKTKAFSNEGLASAALEKTESATELWLKDAIEEGRKKIELLEYEAQKANNGRVRRGKAQQKSDYQVRLEKLMVHFYKWEALLRMVINEEVDNDEVDERQDAIQKILEDDADMDVMEDMSIYEVFDIPEPKVKATVSFDANESDKTATSSKTTTKAKTPLSAMQTTASTTAATPKDSLTASVKAIAPPAPAPTSAVAAPAPAAVPTVAAAAPAAAVPSTPASPAALPASPNVAPATAPTPKALRDSADAEEEAEESVPEWMDDDMDAANDDTFGDDATGLAVGSLGEMASATNKLVKDWERLKPVPTPNSASASAANVVEAKPVKLADTIEAKASAAATPNAWEKRAAEQQNRQKAQQQQHGLEAGSPTSPPASAQPPVQSPAAAAAVSSPAPASSSSPTAPPPQLPTVSTPAALTPVPAATPVSPAIAVSSPLSVTSLAVAAGTGSASAAAAPVVSFQANSSQPSSPAPAAASTSASPQFRCSPKRINELLDMSLGNLPHTLDVQRQRAYEPPNAIDPIPYFPQEVLPVLSNKAVYHQMDLDTLFFIFYYHQKSYQQYFAAKELKARSYRYHTKQQRWYQRLERPQSTTETEERGAYTFFDFEDKWESDRTDDFLFEYRYLENELN